MEEISKEIFNILKGKGYKLKLFDANGQSVTDPELATRFYAYDQDLMVTIRTEGADIQILAQGGQDYDFTSNQELLNVLKKVAHKNLGEFTVRKFNKKIEPKDFVAEGFGPAFGSTKTSYRQFPNATKLIVKHTKAVDEEVKGSRSRNIHSLFIENSQGEKFKFPYKYMSGAKAMSTHVSNGGTPYDEKGTSILGMCEEIADLNKFLRHVKSNKLVNETNEDIVNAVRTKYSNLKHTIDNLSTARGYSSFEVNEEKDEKGVDIQDKFLYNTFTKEDFTKVLDRVGKIIAEVDKMADLRKENLQRIVDIINSKEDLAITYDVNDPDHPNNEDPVKYSGDMGEYAKVVSMISFLGDNTKNDGLSNGLAQLSSDFADMSAKEGKFVLKIIKYLRSKAKVTGSKKTESAIESIVEANLLQKIA